MFNNNKKIRVFAIRKRKNKLFVCFHMKHSENEFSVEKKKNKSERFLELLLQWLVWTLSELYKFSFP